MAAISKQALPHGKPLTWNPSPTTSARRDSAEKYHLPFPLLSDEDKKTVQDYGVWKEKTNYGKTYMGIERTTFVIDREGIIRKIYPKVKVEGHVDEVLDFVKHL